MELITLPIPSTMRSRSADKGGLLLPFCGFAQKQPIYYLLVNSTMLQSQYMYTASIPVDITSFPDLMRIAREVQATKTPHVLKRAQESIAVVMPVATALSKQAEDIWAQYDVKQVRDALQQSAGALTEVDKKILLNDMYAQRSQETR